VLDTFDDPLVKTVEQLGVTGPFGIISGRTAVARLSDDEGVDDWLPMSTSTSEVSVPDYYCPSCDQPQSRVVPADAPERAERDHQHDTVQAAFEAPSSIDTSAASAMESVGLATGGTKNIENFRENVEVGYTPQLEAIGERGCSTTTTSRPVGRTPPTATPCSRPGTQRRSASIR
jgi:Ca-activated chloride channel family protein